MGLVKESFLAEAEDKEPEGEKTYQAGWVTRRGSLGVGKGAERNELFLQTLLLCLKFPFNDFKCVSLPNYSPRTSEGTDLMFHNLPSLQHMLCA